MHAIPTSDDTTKRQLVRIIDIDLSVANWTYGSKIPLLENCLDQRTLRAGIAYLCGTSDSDPNTTLRSAYVSCAPLIIVTCGQLTTNRFV